jgi:hypothetical protein
MNLLVTTDSVKGTGSDSLGWAHVHKGPLEIHTARRSPIAAQRDICRGGRRTDLCKSVRQIGRAAGQGRRRGIDAMSVEAPEGAHLVDAGARAATTSARATLSVVIPALNEARNLPDVPRRMPTGIDEIVSVDGSSADKSIEVARGLRPSAKIISQTRRGKGTPWCGFHAATFDIVVLIDANGSSDPAEISLFIDSLIKSRCR